MGLREGVMDNWDVHVGLGLQSEAIGYMRSQQRIACRSEAAKLFRLV